MVDYAYNTLLTMLTLIVFTTNYNEKKKKRWYKREKNETQITTRVTYTDLTQKIVQEYRRKKFH